MNNIAPLFQQELLKDETILWTGQPDPSVLFTQVDIFFVPFSLLLGGGALALFINAAKNSPDGGFPFIFPDLIIGCYIIFGRFFYKIWKKKQTYYAITNQRLLILNRQWGPKSLQSYFIDSLLSINKSVNENGMGSIMFDIQKRHFITDLLFDNRTRMYQNTGLDFFAPSYGGAFFDIKDADIVYNLIMRNKNA